MKRILIIQSIVIYMATPFLLGQPLEMDVMNLNEKSNEGSGPSDLTSWRDWIYFTAEDGVHGRELWAMSPDGAALQADLDLGVGGSNPHDFSIVGDRFYFSARTGLQTHFYRIDEPGGAPVDLGPNNKSPTERAFFQGAFYYFKNNELWRTHGESGHVEMVATIGTRSAGVSASHSPPRVLGNLLYFVVATQQNQVTLWRSDGTSEATRQVAILYEEIDSPLALEFVEMAALNGDPLVAVAVRSRGEVFDNIWNLWRLQGDSLIKLHSGGADFRQRWFRHFQQVGEVGYFVSGDEREEALFRTDGSTAGTLVVPGAEELFLPDKLTSHNGFLFFTSQGPSRSIYRLDTDENLVEMGRFEDLEYEGRFDTQLVVGSDQRIYLFANALGSAGTSLFRLEADGSDLARIYSGRGVEMLVTQAGIFLTAYFQQLGFEIVKIGDSGLELAADINQTPVAPPSGYSGVWLTSFRDQIYYLNQNETGVHLFRVDGEETSLFKTLESGPFRNLKAPSFFTHGDLLYLIYADKDSQDHLWVSDGSVENTREIEGLAVEARSTLRWVGSNGIGFFLLERTFDNRRLWFLGQDGVPIKLVDLPNTDVTFDLFFPEIAPESLVYPFLAVNDDDLVLWTSDGTPGNTTPIATLFEDYDGNNQWANLFSVTGRLIVMVTFANGFDHRGLTNYDSRIWRFDENAENGTRLVGDFNEVGSPGITTQKLTFPVLGIEPTSLREWLEIDRSGETLIQVEHQLAPRVIHGVSEDSGLVYYSDFEERLVGWDGAEYHLISEERIPNFGSEVVSLCGVDYLLYRDWLDGENRLVIDRVVDPRDGLERVSSRLIEDLTERKLFPTQDGFYITGGDAEGGRELWRLDDRGLSEVTQLRMGPASANPFSMAATDQDLFFFALDDSLTLKLWRERMPNTQLEIEAKPIIGPLYMAYVDENSDASFLWRAENATILGGRTGPRLIFLNYGSARLRLTQSTPGRCDRKGELKLEIENQGYQHIKMPAQNSVNYFPTRRF